MQLLPLEHLPELNQPAMNTEEALEVQQAAGNALADQPGQVNLEIQLGMVLVPLFDLHAEQEGQIPVLSNGSFSHSGLQAWAKFFAPQSRTPVQLKVEVPDKWADFFTLMLLSPQNFTLAKEILSSSMWFVISQAEEPSDSSQPSVSEDPSVTGSPLLNKPSDTPDKGQSPMEKEIALPSKSSKATVNPNTPAFLKKIIMDLSFGSTSDLHIKRKQAKRTVPLVETEVRRSTRLRTQKSGFMRKTYVDKHCLACDVKPLLLSSKIIKNLCINYCKVSPEAVTEDKLAKEPP